MSYRSVFIITALLCAFESDIGLLFALHVLDTAEIMVVSRPLSAFFAS